MTQSLVAGCREERKHAKAKHGMAPKELCIVRFSDTLTLGTCIRGGTLHNPLLEVLTAQMLMMMIDSKQNFWSRIIFRILDE